MGLGGWWNGSQLGNEIRVAPVFVEQVEVEHQSDENSVMFRYQNSYCRVRVQNRKIARKTKIGIHILHLKLVAL